MNGVEWMRYTSSIQWINFTTFTLNAVNEWFIDYISLTSLHFASLRSLIIQFHTIPFINGMKWIDSLNSLPLPSFRLIRLHCASLSWFHSVYTSLLQFMLRCPFHFMLIPLTAQFAFVQFACCHSITLHQFHSFTSLHTFNWFQLPLHY